jgi:hypothetical protein
MYSYLSPEERVRKDHPLRAIRELTDEILKRMSPLFEAMYAEGGRPSIAPEKLLRAQLVQMLYSVRSERLLMEEIAKCGFFSSLLDGLAAPTTGRTTDFQLIHCRIVLAIGQASIAEIHDEASGFFVMSNAPWRRGTPGAAPHL